MSLEIIPVITNKEIKKGDDLVKIFTSSYKGLSDGDVIVVSQKVVSKQEGQLVELSGVIPSLLAVGIAAEYEKDPRLIEVILHETKRLVRMENRILITETRHGFICANAGVDESNLPQGFAAMLPENPDKSASDLRVKLQDATGKKIAVLIADTFGRPFREGQTNCAIGVSGMRPIHDYAGTKDTFGRVLRITAIAEADELCSAAELVMKKTKNCPFVIVRNFDFSPSDDTVRPLIRSEKTDLFR
ncbi:coenzyme F420-0:L-glutamate ligase [Candidatus Nitrosotenuis chungbukensis]|uniref:coenzyme F420-0:L-glutamate ligase n=1 Tax=Candidatus Nitrosotenuis chungbukensis TaxID=1353246 RepID=UPI0005B2E93B|nr:coenzyme F420-0:L-glutamate ligase [Candidatus Nitrosotenuis chungbukensis]WKT57318.1 coenzyme F420-0:L-glutamate ligase [Candidatus Nitrosotenuis chungbukensis]